MNIGHRNDHKKEVSVLRKLAKVFKVFLENLIQIFTIYLYKLNSSELTINFAGLKLA